MSNELFLKELLENLKKPVPYQWRVQSFSKTSEQATVVAYIDARDAQDILDKHCTYGWTRRHYDVCGNVYCTVGIYMPDGSLIERSDCGVESNQDAKKGEASDSFKRACVNWGVGRFLYDMKIQYLKANEKKTQSNYPFCVDDSGKRIYDITKYVNDRGQKMTTPILDPSKDIELQSAIKAIESAKTLEDVKNIWSGFKSLQSDAKFSKAKEDMKIKLTIGK